MNTPYLTAEEIATASGDRRRAAAWRLLADAATRKALEWAAQRCELIGDDKFNLYKGRAPYSGREPERAQDFVQGQSDGAYLCQTAINEAVKKEGAI